MSITIDSPTLAAAKNILKTSYGYSDFRLGQEAIVQSILNGQDTIAIMPTGAGKSICFQIPALLSSGLTLVFSPLISLMKDQIDTLNSLGIPATYINSTLDYRSIQEILSEAGRGAYKLLYLAPERLASPQFVRAIAHLDISLVAIDEAHCISTWGHDFRPSYRQITGFLKSLPRRPIVTAFTATATEEVREDIVELLNIPQTAVHITGFDRPNLKFSVYREPDKNSLLMDTLNTHQGQSGIIYAATRKEVEKLYQLLKDTGYAVGKYHAGLSDRERHQAQEDFLFDRLQIMVATNAFGMGIDKSDVRFVLHYNMPRNLEAYYQEAGRAGRDGEPAECSLLFSPQDVRIQKFLLGQSEMDPILLMGEYSKLQTMVDYCHTSGCLRKYILAYFGENAHPERCHHCSSCCDERDEVDITLAAQQIFSCIYHMRERYGISTIADVLKGSRREKILQLNLDKISTYGLMQNYRVKDIKDLIQVLIADDYLYLTEGEYPVVRMRMTVKEVLRGQAKVFRKMNRIQQRQPFVDNTLFDQLRQCRRELAQEAQVPPYVIFSDATLREMSEKQPKDEIALAQIKGVGTVKLEKYGSVFLTIIQAHTQRTSRPSGSHSSHLQTLALYSSGLNFSEIAKERQLHINTLQEHLLRCASEGHEIEWDLFFTPDQEQGILEQVKTLGSERLRPLKEALPETVSYTAIKAVLTKHGYRS